MGHSTWCNTVRTEHINTRDRAHGVTQSGQGTLAHGIEHTDIQDRTQCATQSGQSTLAHGTQHTDTHDRTRCNTVRTEHMVQHSQESTQSDTVKTVHTTQDRTHGSTLPGNKSEKQNTRNQ